ncbi:hypothetical protein [Leifsonia shinshuensis]
MRTVRLRGSQSESFSDAVATLFDADELALGGDDKPSFELDYVATPSGSYPFPATIWVSTTATLGDVAAFFGTEVVTEPAALRVRPRQGRGDNAFYIAEVAAHWIEEAFTVYGYALAGIQLARFVARRRAHVPSDAVRRWKLTGELPVELRDYLRIEPVRRADIVENLLDVSAQNAVALLRLSGFHLLTGDGENWIRDTVEDRPAHLD